MNRQYPALLVSLLLLPFTTTARADILAYYPLDEVSGTNIPNLAGSAPNGEVFAGATWFSDPIRGQVLSFDGVDGYASLGSATIPQITPTGAFTWSFWALSESSSLNATVLGNRYNAANGNPVPLEFIKFTPQNFEFHSNGGQNLSYVDMVEGVWTHHMLVQSGNTFTYFRDGHFSARSTFTNGTLGTQPLFLGGDRLQENWAGKIDDVALWTNAMPLSAVAKIAAGTASPASVSMQPPAFTVAMSDSFSGSLSQWNVTNRGLENNAPAGYNEPSVNGSTVTLSGTTTNQFWYGSSLESVQTFDSSLETLVSVDRVSLTGTGSAFRSSLWILGDNAHYIHFSQNIGESGWTFNARDDGGLGTLLPTGSGTNIPGLDTRDTDGGLANMAIHLVPVGDPGDVWMYLLLDGQVYADRRFTNFPDTFQVVLTGQARATGDSVSATFDNLLVQQVPEPGSALLLIGGLAVAASRRRRA